VVVNGHDTRTAGAAVRREVGFVFADPDAQIVMPTVGEDVAFSLRRSGLSRHEQQARALEVLGSFGLGGHADHPAHLLSGGQKQLLALASVLVTDPRVLVCDEPTTLLDLRNARRVAALLLELDQQVVLVTHHLDLVADYDRVLVVDEGRIAFDGPPEAAVDAYTALMHP
jgi:biotin transport system ATP-binding protein